jgi:hypothetical protein
VRYSLCCRRARSGDEISCRGDALGVSGWESVTLATGRSEDWALLMDPLRERYGEFEPLASTHSSS